MNESDSNERISAFVDGELRDSMRVRVVDALYESPELRRTWTRFHLIGDAIRGVGPVPGAESIADKVSATLSDEHVVPLKPRAGRRGLAPLSGLALAASVAAVAVLGIRSLDDGSATQPTAGPPNHEVAAASSVANAPNAAMPQSVTDDAQPARRAAARLAQWNDVAPNAAARLNVYLVSHNEYAGSAVHGVLPYVRLVGHQSVAGDSR